MKGYIARKITYALISLYVIATLNFLIFQVFSPVTPVDTLLDPRWTPEMKERLKELWGLDQPIHVRYVRYIINMFTFNLGYSFSSWRPVANEILARLPNTLLLLGSALIVTILVGIPIGILAASRRGTKLDVFAIGVGLFAWAAPAFLIQLLFLLFFCRYLGWFPFGGMFPPGKPPEGLAYISTVAYHSVLPVTTIVLANFGFWALYTRNMMLDSLTHNFIGTARAKGLKERTVLYKHAFRAILPPVATMIALSIPPIFTGAVITEQIFTWPGIGYWLLTSMRNYDYPAVQGLFFMFATLVIGANFISDLIYGFLDPRIRVGVRR